MMMDADCMRCNNRVNRPYPYSRAFMGDCAMGMRSACTAGGGAPDDMRDVHRCADYDEEQDGDDS